MIDDIIAISPETRTGTVDGVSVMFRAYIAHDRTERLVWKVDETTGNNAMLDKAKSTVILPQGKKVDYKGKRSHYLHIPRWLADALMNDFEEFEEETIDPMNDATNNLTKEDSESESDDEITPIFDDMDVDS